MSNDATDQDTDARWHTLTPDSVDDLTSRYEFGDACVREVIQRSSYGKGSERSGSVVIDVRTKSELEWVTLRLEFRHVRNYRIVDINTFSWVLYDSPHLAKDGTGLLHLDFDTTTPEDLRTPEEMGKASHLYFAARAITWTAVPGDDATG
ncbi:hypothetical protein R8Z50_01445 [Longispora sp. K20-0274]|uniref:hypothetical protein n=1 Tax=Longispora sp. K20-0274 TaxID=3088255 RepID=UPI00399A1A77